MSNLKIENLCPVCGFEMDVPPERYNICPSCGTEFGLHDANSSIQELRGLWIERGPEWWSQTDPRPTNWNPFAQLARVLTSSAAVMDGESVVVVKSESMTATSYPTLLANFIVQPWVTVENVLVDTEPAVACG